MTRPNRIEALRRIAQRSAQLPEPHIAQRLSALSMLMHEDADAFAAIARARIAAKDAWVRQERQKRDISKAAARLEAEMIEAAATEDEVDERKEWRDDIAFRRF